MKTETYRKFKNLMIQKELKKEPVPLQDKKGTWIQVEVVSGDRKGMRFPMTTRRFERGIDEDI